MTKKQIARCCAFLLVICMTLVVVNDLFELENTTNYDKRFSTYRNLKSNIIDVVTVGTSGLDRYYIAAKGFEDYGLSVYNLTSDAMPCWLYKNVIEYAYEFQNPELLVVDIRAFTQDNNIYEEVDARGRRVLDAMNLTSPARIRAGFKAMEISHKLSQDNPKFDLSYLLSFVKFHGKWQEDDYYISKNLFSRAHKYGSFYINSERTLLSYKNKAKPRDPELRVELDPISEEALYEVIDFLKKKELNVLFIETPKFETKEEMGRANIIREVIKENGFKNIDFCETDENGTFIYAPDLVPETDFYNEGHVNYYGAEKFTPVLAEYLRENYDLPDRRNDEKASSYWTGIYDTIKLKVEELKIQKELEAQAEALAAEQAVQQ